MAIYSTAVIRAYSEEYTLEDVRALRLAALKAQGENLPRVEITSVTLEGGGGAGQFVDKDPLELIELMTAVMDYMAKEDTDGKRRNDAIVHGDFSRRQVGW
ncbi:MAG: hypothetical protein ACSHX0_06830 [Akkermansiaceae bacterium]